MPQMLTIEVPDTLAEAWSKLPPARRSSLVDYAKYLAAQEPAPDLTEVDAEDEAAWSVLLEDPARTANFQRWAAASLAESPPEPLDPAKL